MPEVSDSGLSTAVGQDPGELIGQLRRTLGRLEAALASISDALVITDRDSRVLWCNQAFETLMQRPRLLLLGQAITAVLPPDAEGRPLLEGERLDGGDGGRSGLRAVLRHDPLQAVSIEWRPVLSEPERPLVFCIRDISADLSNEAMQMEVRRIAAERLHLEEQVLACAVTGLPNRRALERRLVKAFERLRERPGQLTLLFCDLNGFKQINDLHGHAVGDALLVTVGQRLQSCLRADDLVARLGGDEFVVFSEGPRSAEEALNLGVRLLDALAQPWSLEGRILHPSMSVGIAMTDDPDLGGAQLLQQADLAMYDAKGKGSLPLSLHDSTLELRTSSRLQLGRLLQRALARPQEEGLLLHYRPIVELRDGSLHGYEVSPHLERAGGDPCSGSALLTMAERTGQAVALGQWIRTTALEELRRLRSGGEPGSLVLRTCVSELRQRGFCAALQELTRRSGVDPAWMAVMLDGDLLLDPPPHLAAELQELRDLGVRVVLDRFGDGFTDLAALAQLPLDAVRVRSSLLRGTDGEGQRRLGQAAVKLALDLGLAVIADGIDSEARHQQLLSLGCRWGQGPHLGAPQQA